MASVNSVASEITLYLLAHGLAKIILVAGVLTKQRWAYPAAIGFLCLFICYQLYRLSFHASAGLALLTLLDIAIVGLIWREYHMLDHQETA